MKKEEVRKTVRQGTILRFLVESTKKGTTTVQYEVNVYRGKGDLIFSTHVTLVSIDEKGRKKTLPK